MAPILAKASGVIPQVIDDENLRTVLTSLNALKAVSEDAAVVSSKKPLPSGILDLCTILEPWHREWRFEEQVDLHEWIPALNAMDAALTWILKNNGSNLLLLDTVNKQKNEVPINAATNLQQIHECPPLVLNHLNIILQFTTALLRNSISKSLYASVPAMTYLLAAADETVCDNAVAVLAALSIPPTLHKQQAPEHSAHTTALHSTNNGSDVHDRLTATARAWGTRANGLGLFSTISADDSVHGQGALPISIGQVRFCYYHQNAPLDDNTTNDNTAISSERSSLHEINISLQEMMVEASEATTMVETDDEDGDHEISSNKRRRVSLSSSNRKIKSTAELFFLAIEKAGGRDFIPPDRLFSLLADIRLARSFHTQATRIQAVQRRLLALITILHAHPSQEVISGYFQAQPELAAEIVDLLRPTVSGANVSSIATSNGSSSSPTSLRLRPDALSVLVCSTTQNVPYEIRMLSLEALTALVSRRDGSTSGVSGSLRISSVLTELGVGKGQYLGLLPTLIRSSLAALNSTPSFGSFPTDSEMSSDEPLPDTIDVGLAFAEATMPPPMLRREQVEKGLLFIDALLALTSAVVGTPAGTPALVDCGLISALLGTVSMDVGAVLSSLLPGSPMDRRLFALFRFVAAQAVQILEGTIVTHNNALTSFHDLQGVDVLTHRLWREMTFTETAANGKRETSSNTSVDGDTDMKDAFTESKTKATIVSSQRVILYSIVTCLTVVFHQESSTSTIPSGGAQLRKKELTRAIIEILDGVQSYGGHLASLVLTLLSDIMNNDQHVVEYVHSSGIATSFINMILGEKRDDGSCVPIVPPVHELIMGIPNVILALSLTEDGAKAVYNANPFPAFLLLFHHPNYAMPNSRCLLNEMTAIVGTGLDEIMRHVERLKPLILAAFSNALTHVLGFAEDLLTRENSITSSDDAGKSSIENERSHLIQYVLNFGQLLEQILNNEEHCDPFVEAGGLDVLLKLLPSTLPPNSQFLAYLSCLSSPSVSTLHHSTTEETISQALKAIEFRYDPLKLIQRLVTIANTLLDECEESRRLLLNDNNGQFVLDEIPREPIYRFPDTANLNKTAIYLRNVTKVQWITSILANAMKAASQRNNESTSGWSRIEREWKKELSSQGFEDFIQRLSTFYRGCLFEVCRSRTQQDFEELEISLQTRKVDGIHFRLRIVCPEGAVVRDGIEIDSCTNVGSMEMGDIVDSFDRCINSSGILRYRTKRGWVSEMTRGHGREPIAEVISIYKSSSDDAKMENDTTYSKKRVEIGIPSLRSVAISVLARGQVCYSDLFGSISKLATQGVRSNPGRTISFEEGSQGSYVSSLMKLLAVNLTNGFGYEHVAKLVRGNVGEETRQDITDAGAAMYLSCYFGHVLVYLFDEKRETRLVNFTLLVSLLATDPFVRSLPPTTPPGLFDAMRFVFKYGLADFETRGTICETSDIQNLQQRVARGVAASFPPLFALLRKLVSTPFSSSPSASILSRMKLKDVSRLLGDENLDLTSNAASSDSFFCPENFVADLHGTISSVVKELWTDPRLLLAPPYLVHPLALLVDEIIVVLLDATKKKQQNSIQANLQRQTERIRLSELTRRRQEEADQEEAFEPSEEAVNQLMEMGFSRDHAIDALESTGSNRIESAMDYALSNPPPSAATIERRRAQREERERRRTESLQQQRENRPEPPANETGDSVQNEQQMVVNDETANEQKEQDGEVGKTIGIKQQDSWSTNAKSVLSSWLDVAPNVCCDFMASMKRDNLGNFHKLFQNKIASKDGHGENEALTVVLCSFLLNLCNKFPESRSGIVAKIFRSLKHKLTKRAVGDAELFFIADENEASVASLCHATVLIARALPKTRLLILKEGLISSLTACIKSLFAPFDGENGNVLPPGVNFPLWLTPALLLLDVMAQPMVAFSDKDFVKSIEDGAPDDEFVQLQREHNGQAEELVQIVNGLFDQIRKPKTETALNSKSAGEKDVASDDGMDVEYTDSQAKDTTAASPFATIPAYFPLLSYEVTQQCIEICQKLLCTPQGNSAHFVLPPGIAHATLLLLLRLLRNPKVSSQFLQAGVAEAVLVLPHASAFTGNTGLVTLILRRLLEDEPTLQAAMETEIRGTVTKLLAKKPANSNDTKPAVSLASFMEAVTPLLCRHPSLFLKALVLSVSIEYSDRDGKECKVSILSNDDRMQRVASFNETGPTSLSSDLSREDFSRSKRMSSGSKGKGKSQQKSSKRHSFSKKLKREKSDDVKHTSVSINDSPATHVTSLIVNTIISSSTKDPSDQSEAFLEASSLLEILADLILAVPACASAVHNYRPHRSKEKSKKISPVLSTSHALTSCPPPPKTFVTFLLHSLVPQDRWSIRNDPKIWDRRKGDDVEATIRKSQKRTAYRKLKLSQASARVLIALVVRPGEGRKRVIADLVFALSGGNLGHGAVTLSEKSSFLFNETSNSELEALSAWGELCVGLIAPRSNGKNLDGISSLSVDNLRLMLEYGMAHALMYALQRVNLFHPMTSTVCSTLLLPLEILTRPGVTDAVRDLVTKDNESKEVEAIDDKNVISSEKALVSSFIQTPSFSTSEIQNIEASNDVHFSQISRLCGTDSLGGIEDEEEESSDEDDDEEDDEESSSEESEEQSDAEDEEEEESEVDGMNEEEEHSDMEDSDESSSDEVEEEGGWDVDYNDTFSPDGQGGRQELEDVGDEGTEQIDEILDEGWTRIDSTGFNGLLLGGRRGGFNALSDRSRVIDAAETMIGSLIRNGDISGEALAELEGTLGIRIMSGGSLLRASLRPVDSEGGFDSFVPLRVLEMEGQRRSERERERESGGDAVGALPHIHQRSQPEVGYSTFGRGHGVEISSMEYVFGGPCVTGGSRNYDLHTPLQDEADSESQFTPTQSDLNVFPGGPAAAASARTQHSLHPLLCSVDLPPINSLVSDLLPQGLRATRRGQTSMRRPGDVSTFGFAQGGYVVSTSNGHIVRANRPNLSAPLGGSGINRIVMGPVGWTDDGIPLDATIEEFGSAFERAIGEAARTSSSSTGPSTQATQDSSPAVATATDALRNDTEDNDVELDHNNDVLVSEIDPNVDVANHFHVGEQESVRSEGERVATSLAEGLRLSPGSDRSLQSETGPMATSDAAALNEEHPTIPLPLSESHLPVNNSESVLEFNIEETSVLHSHNISGGEHNEITDDAHQVVDGLAETTDVDMETIADRIATSNEVTGDAEVAHNENGLVCPPDIDLEVFNSLPREMQQDCIDEYNAAQELAAQLDGSTLDPAVLAELPPEMRREVIEQDLRERRMREQEQASADPARAEELDIASFIATLSTPQLREEVLLTAEESVLNNLPPDIQAEARVLRERASLQRGLYDSAVSGGIGHHLPAPTSQAGTHPTFGNEGLAQLSARRKQRSGKIRVELDRPEILYTPDSLAPAISKSDVKTMFCLFYLLSPVRPPRLQQKLLQNLCMNPVFRSVVSTTILKLLHDDGRGAREAVDALENHYSDKDSWRKLMDSIFSVEDYFPPSGLLGAALETPLGENLGFNLTASLLRRKEGLGTAAAMAANLPKSAGTTNLDTVLPPVVATRLIEALQQLLKSSARFCMHTLVAPLQEIHDTTIQTTCFEKLLELLEKPLYWKSATNLDQLLNVLESAVSPLSHISKHPDDEAELSQTHIDSAASAGKEWVDVPRISVSQSRLQLLCSILRMETCRDTAFSKVNTIVRRLCRIESNRGFVLAELASVAHALGGDATRDLRALRIRMEAAITQQQHFDTESSDIDMSGKDEVSQQRKFPTILGTISSSVSLSTSTSELKLLRVLQTLHALCNDGTEDQGNRKNEGSVLVTEELVHLLRQMQFDELWDELTACLKVVQILEGVKTFEEEQKASEDHTDHNDEGSNDDVGEQAKKLRNSAAGLLTRFLPAIEAFFVANASATKPVDSGKESDTSGNDNEELSLENLVGGQRLVDFVTSNKVLLNALLRNNSALLDKGLRALVQVPRCRSLLDFDVKRQWFKTQMRRLRQQAARRNSSLRLVIRRNYVFEDAYHHLRVRNADEMRGRLHITFRNEEGVDAGGLSREFFGILAKEIFNPNYALFTSTEDGCTFQPNPNSSINPDHLSYFRFVGRIVGKAVADSFLLDAHFTRSLYKHMLGLEPTHHDMEAIDPDYYRNLTTILQYNLADIGLDLTFSIQDNSFGRHQVIDLIPNGRNIPVTEENKEEYVRKVCQHRMTTAIQSQIKAYLDGFYELVSRDLIAVFTPRELELLISGMPEIDLHDLKKHTDYVGWKATDKEIEWFWNILFSLSPNEKAAFLQFVTGSSKVPLAGFSELQGMRGVQKFSIHRAGTKGALMSAHTCFNSLDLPVYDSEEEMREKLLYSINEGGGAFLFA